MEKIRTEATPQISVEYADRKGEFVTDIFYNVSPYDAEIQEADAPISCTLKLSGNKVFTDLAPLVSGAIALLNPIMSQPYKPNFEMKGDALLLSLTDRQAEIIIAALNLVYVESQQPDFTGFTADATLEELGALLIEIKNAQTAQL